ncbi:uncharacterized protein [Hetaerina americana]|uniref:uncharacterized protein n=1 Tax=Hetaerina americana TaxID=62018 RepID=UPI003A7F2145
MVLKWNEVEIDHLISLVMEFPALYDISSEEYTDKVKKDKIWENVGKKIGTSARNCRRKWTGMCLKYKRLKEAGTTFENGEEWPWYLRISFIDRYILEDQENGYDGNAETSEGASTVPVESGANKGATKDLLKSLNGNVTSVHLPSRELHHINRHKTTLPTVSTNNPASKGTSITSVEDNESQSILNANKLFLESLANDLSSLDVKEQYDFKVETLVLLRSYLLKHRT